MTGMLLDQDLRRFHGKYRGHVVDNKDPLQLGRILALVPAVDGLASNWALPCTPYAGPGVGMLFLPPVGALVWIEFEGGDPSHPIWVGGFWGVQEDVPIVYGRNADDPAQVKVIRTTSTTVVIDDTADAGEVMVQIDKPAVSAHPVTLTFDSEGAKLVTGVCTITVQPEDGVTSKVSETMITQTPQSITAVSQTITLKTAPTQLELAIDGVTLSSPEVEATVEGEVTLTAAQTGITSIVEVTGTATFVGAVSIEGATEIVGALSVAGATALEGGAAILGGGTIDGAPIL